MGLKIALVSLVISLIAAAAFNLVSLSPKSVAGETAQSSSTEETLVVEDNGAVSLMVQTSVLGDSTSPAAKSQSNSKESNNKNPPTTKVVPLVPPNSNTLIQAVPSSSGSNKIQVTIKQLPPDAAKKSGIQPSLTPVPIPSKPQNTQAPQAAKASSIPSPNLTTTPPNSQNKTTSPLQTPLPSPVVSSNSNTINASVNQVILQGKTSQNTITIKPSLQNQITIQQQGDLVSTSLPIQISTQNHSIGATTSSGFKAINVLPKEAMDGVTNQGLLNSSPTQSTKEVSLVQDNGDLVYQINGNKSGKLLGLFSVSSPVNIKLSAQTGKVLQVNESPIFQYLGFFVR